MFPFGGILPKAGVFVEDVNEDFTGAGFVNQEIAFELDGTFGEAGYAGPTKCSGTLTLYPNSWWRGSPLANIGSNFEVRCASISVGAWDAEPAAVGTWIAISAKRCWNISRTGGKGGEDPGTDNLTSIFEIRDIATSTIRATFNVVLAVTKT